MNIKVSLPSPNNTCGKEIKSFLRQLELSVHHLQKTYEEMEKNDEIMEDTFLMYRFPLMNFYNKEEDNEGFIKIHIDEISEEMQDIEIEISQL